MDGTSVDQTFPKLPYIAIKRITVPVHIAPHGKVRRSVLRGALDRIQHLPRSHVGSSAEEDFLNARASVYFDDTVHSIRAQTAALLKRVHTPIPHAVRPLPISSFYKYIETPLPERIDSDAYISVMLLSPNERVRRDVLPMSYYPKTTQSRNSIGRGHLACVSFAAGRAYPRRKLVLFDENNGRNVRNDIQYLSHYSKTRAEVAKQHPKIDEKAAKLQEDSTIKPAQPTYTHVSFQTPLKTEEELLKPLKPTEPLYSDDAENVFQKEEEIDAWLTHQKKKKSKKDAENNENQLNEEIAEQENELAQTAKISAAAKEQETENRTQELIEEISEEPVSESKPEEATAETAEIIENIENETNKETEAPSESVLEVESVPEIESVPEVESVVTEPEEILEQEIVETKDNVIEEKTPAQLSEPQETPEEIEEVIKTEEVKEDYEPVVEAAEQNEEETAKPSEVEVEQEQTEETQIEEHIEEIVEEVRESSPALSEKIEEVPVEEEEVKIEDPTDDAEVKITEEEEPPVIQKNDDTDVESVKEEIVEDEKSASLSHKIAEKSVAEDRKLSEGDKDCSTLERKDNDGPKSDTEISDLEEDECEVPEKKQSIKDTLNPADTVLDLDASLVDDVFEDETPAENKIQSAVTTEAESEEESE